MEKLKRKTCRWLLVAATAVAAAACPFHLLATSTAEQALLARAQSLVAHGHLDMAVQTWQQVLLSDPGSKEALLGIARADMQLGKPQDAEKYLDKLRVLGGNGAAIAQIEAMPHVQPPAERLDQARRLAQSGQYAEAMRVYQSVWGDEPPAGDSALAYYDTEAAVPADRAQATNGLRKLAQQFPADPRYAITLGRILTYDPKTRAEGVAILRQYPDSAAAKDALKQSEAWNQMAPAAGAATAANSAGTGGNPLEASAYRSLNSGHLDDAQQQFQELLARSPDNPAALSGMGYVLMKQKNFAGAATYLEQARAAGARGLESSLALVHFYQQMAKGNEELKNGNSDAAIEDYRAATAMNAASPEAQEALAGALMQKGDAVQAADSFARAVRMAPDHSAAWRGLFVAQSAEGDAQGAVATSTRMPAAVQAQLNTDPDYLRALAEDDVALGRRAEANSVVQRALALPFPNQGRDLPPDRQMQYAALLMTAQRYEPALRLYRQVIAADPENIGAWRSLVAAQHQLARDDEALATIGRMPQAAFTAMEGDAGFLALVGSIYQGQKEWERAQSYLERALTAGNAPNASIELQLADVYAAEGKTQEAYAIYSRQAQDNPASLPAWRGVLGTLHLEARDRDALQQLASMPESTRLRIESDPGYLQTLASIEVATSHNQDALKTFDRLASIYADRNIPEPPDVQLQYGWVLLQLGDDQKLYALVSNIANAGDFTDEQEANFNRLLAAWSVRRANSAAAAGDQRRSLAILESAEKALPGNPDVLSSLAGAYLKAGYPGRAVVIYETLGMTNAGLPQYRGAIGAALAAGDMKHAAVWLESALDRFRGDATILKMAAQYEQATGNSERAVAYYRAALAAMGPDSPAEMFPRPGNGVNGIPGNGDSPTRDLMDLLAPAARTSRNTGSGDVSEDRGPVNLSWQEAPPQAVATLGDFAESGSNDGAALPAMAQQQEGSVDRLSDFAPLAHAPETSETAELRAPSTPVARRRKSPKCCDDPDRIRTQRQPQLAMQLPAENFSRPRSIAAPTRVSIDPNAPLRMQSASHTVMTPEEPSLSAVLPEEEAGDTSSAVRLQSAARALVTQDVTYQPPLAVAREDSAPDAGMRMIPQNTAQDPGPLSQPLVPLADQELTPPPVIQTTPENTTTNLPPLRNEPLQLPPLTGPATPVVPTQTPREQINQQIAVIEGASSRWLGGSSGISYRSGQAGYDQLTAYSAQSEESGMFGPDARLTVITGPVLLDSGSATGSATLRQGTLPATSVPSSESASGLGSEAQLRTSHFAVDVGTTPRGFLVANVIGGLYIHPPSGHFTLTLARDPIVDTQLSYAGLRDQGSASLTFPGNVWGGVITNSGELQIASGGSNSGWYMQGGGQYIEGVHVPTNTRYDGDVGAYWAVWHNPQYGNLTVGMNFFGMHYAQNLRFFTYGQGGYFSPDAYVLAGMPITFHGHYQEKFHYDFTASLGLQAFNEESSAYFPLDPAIQTAQGNLYYPAQTNVGGNYNFDAEGSYAIAEHWYAGGYMDFNNTRDYASSRIGFFLRYLFRPQPIGQETGPTGLFPVSGYRPLQVP